MIIYVYIYRHVDRHVYHNNWLVVPAYLRYAPRKDLMKMCEFLLSDPYEKSDAERLKNANTCMSRSHLSQLNRSKVKVNSGSMVEVANGLGEGRKLEKIRFRCNL